MIILSICKKLFYIVLLFSLNLFSWNNICTHTLHVVSENNDTVFFKQVERAIGRMKFYRILATTWDLTLVKCANSILLVIAALVNLQPPLVKKV